MVDEMDRTWRPPRKEISYVVCPSCNQLVKEEEIVKKLKICRMCAQFS